MSVRSPRTLSNLLFRLHSPIRHLLPFPSSSRLSLLRQPFPLHHYTLPNLRTCAIKTPSNPSAPSIPTSLPAPLQQASHADIVLSPPALVVTREYEWANILVGFEQANKYTIRAAPAGTIVGYLAEEESVGRTVTRNLLRTRRPFKATIFSPDRQILFTIRRPIFLISSSILVEAPDGTLIGEVHMHWHLWRRRYTLFVDKTQFASVDSGFLAVDFDMRDEQGHKIASVNKDFTGFAREIFTDARQYVLRMDPSFGLHHDGHLVRDSATVDLAHEQYSDVAIGNPERAVVLATAIAIDFDYFSVHSRGHMHPGLMMMPGGGGAAPQPPPPNAGMGGAGTVVGADVLSDMAHDQQPGPDPAPLDSPDTPSDNQDPFSQPQANVDPGDTAQQSEWATFEEPDHGFEDDPYADKNTWTGEGDDSWSGDGAGLGDGDGEGGRGVIGAIMDVFRIFSNDE